MAGCPVSHHGVSSGLGCKHLALGRFGRLLPDLESTWNGDEVLLALGAPGGLMHDEDDSSADAPIPAGYTFFAQFVDHDVTLDTTSELASETPQDPTKLPNLRSPSLDLDCVYGFGPEASPHLYRAGSGGRLLTGSNGNPDDLARNEAGTALIGDPRNDENLFVSQLQLAFVRLHNRMLDRNVGRYPDARERFEKTQEAVRHHYQYVVLHDFLRRVCNENVWQYAIGKLADPGFPHCLKPDAHGLPMPVEFSVAAYRFGHSMVRSFYPANGENPRIELFDEAFGTLGFSAVPPELTVDWSMLLPIDKCVSVAPGKAVDHLLADEIMRLPDPVVADRDATRKSLAFRNLLRGRSLGLPSGQAAAAALAGKGYPIATGLDFDAVPGFGALAPAVRDEIVKASPLFFYLLAESTVQEGGARLGATGSAILMEVFVAMLKHCGTSFLEHGRWAPDPCVEQCDPKWGLQLADLVRHANG